METSPERAPLAVSVVLVSPRNPLNIGAVARAMSNFGFSDLRLINAYEVAFREAKSAVNAAAVLQQARCYSSLPEAVADCAFVAGATGVQHRDITTPVHRLEQGAQDLLRAGEAGRAALVFGSEKYGLSRDDISHCHQLLHIPTRPAHDSMNLGQAVAICLYELVRVDRAALPKPRSPRRAPTATVDRLHAQLASLLKRTGYIKRRISASSELKLRRLLLRLRLNVSDATLLLGMVRQIDHALDDRSIVEKSAEEWRDPTQD